jgi:hypothetical protein
MIYDKSFWITVLIVFILYWCLFAVFVRISSKRLLKKVQEEVEKKRGQPPRKSEFVTIDDDRITVRMHGKPTLTISWDEIEEFSIVTTSAGPASEDYWYILDGAGQNRVIIPGIEGEEFLHYALKRFKNLDQDALINSIGSTREAHFLIWKKEN